jgi:Ricin-type beta-trefoil lectin domain
MRRMPRLSAVLAVAGLATFLSVGVTASARADVVPQPPWSEIFPPLTDNLACLDDPSGSATPGTMLQLFHCHGYASNGGPQRWLFNAWGAPNVQNLYHVNSHNLCLGGDPNHGLTPGERAELVTCSGLVGGPIWKLHSRNAYSGDPYFMLVLGGGDPTSGNYCLALPNFSGSNGEPVILEPCNTNDELQYWNLG